MNKKMQELSEKLAEKRAAAQLALDDGDMENAATLADECDQLAKDYDTTARIYQQAQKAVGAAAPAPVKKADPWATLSKFIRRGSRALSDEEKALMTPSDARKALVTGDDATQGENYLIPEDVDTAIRELRKSYVSAASLVTEIYTDSLAGSFVFESGGAPGLVGFDDGDDIDATEEPSFTSKAWAIKLKGAILPVSNVLIGAEKSGLMTYLNRWFVKRSIVTENADIFSAIQTAKASAIKQLTGWRSLRQSINVDLDPSCLIGGVVVTNQSGYNYLDISVDDDGRPLLTESIATPGVKYFNGLPVTVFADAMLPNVEDDDDAQFAPFFYGNLKAAIYMIRKNGLGAAESDHWLFGKNQKALRLIEGYDVITADADACCYGLLDLSGSEEALTITVDPDTGIVTASNGVLTATHTLSDDDDADFIAANIVKNKVIFGTTGTAE